jgi:hypothetical protein
MHRLRYQIIVHCVPFFQRVEYFIYFLLIYAAIPIVIRLNDDDRTLAAYAQASGGGYYGVYASVGALFRDVLYQRCSALLVACALSVSRNSV